MTYLSIDNSGDNRKKVYKKKRSVHVTFPASISVDEMDFIHFFSVDVITRITNLYKVKTYLNYEIQFS